MTDQVQQVELIVAEDDKHAPLTIALNRLAELKVQVDAIPDEAEYQKAIATIEGIETKLAEHSEAAGEFFEMLSQQREDIFMELSLLQSAVANPLNTAHPQVLNLVIEVADAISTEVSNDGVARGEELARSSIEEKLIENIQYHVNTTWTEAQSLVRAFIYDWEKGLTESQAEIAMEWIGAMRR